VDKMKKDYVNVPSDITEVWQCNECPKFEYENGKGICYKLDRVVEGESMIDKECPYRKKKGKKKK
jgi:hypothetical protein